MGRMKLQFLTALLLITLPTVVFADEEYTEDPSIEAPAGDSSSSADSSAEDSSANEVISVDEPAEPAIEPSQENQEPAIENESAPAFEGEPEQPAEALMPPEPENEDMQIPQPDPISPEPIDAPVDLGLGDNPIDPVIPELIDQPVELESGDIEDILGGMTDAPCPEVDGMVLDCQDGSAYMQAAERVNGKKASVGLEERVNEVRIEIGTQKFKADRIIEANLTDAEKEKLAAAKNRLEKATESLKKAEADYKIANDAKNASDQALARAAAIQRNTPQKIQLLRTANELANKAANYNRVANLERNDADLASRTAEKTLDALEAAEKAKETPPAETPAP